MVIIEVFIVLYNRFTTGTEKAINDSTVCNVVAVTCRTAVHKISESSTTIGRCYDNNCLGTYVSSVFCPLWDGKMITSFINQWSVKTVAAYS